MQDRNRRSGIAADAAILDPRSSFFHPKSSILGLSFLSSTQSEVIVIFFLHEEFGTGKYGNR
jgi:hypothetical protein